VIEWTESRFTQSQSWQWSWVFVNPLLSGDLITQTKSLHHEAAIF